MSNSNPIHVRFWLGQFGITRGHSTGDFYTLGYSCHRKLQNRSISYSLSKINHIIQFFRSKIFLPPKNIFLLFFTSKNEKTFDFFWENSIAEIFIGPNIISQGTFKKNSELRFRLGQQQAKILSIFASYFVLKRTKMFDSCFTWSVVQIFLEI